MRSTQSLSNLLLHRAPGKVHEHDEDQCVDQHTRLSGLAGRIGDHVTDHWQLAGQVVGHGVRNQEKHNEKENLRHLYYIFGKNMGVKVTPALAEARSPPGSFLLGDKEFITRSFRPVCGLRLKGTC